MSKYEPTFDHNNMICPYCGDERYVDPEDYLEDGKEEVEQCDNPECGKKFFTSFSYDVSINAKPDCELNGMAHDWKLNVLKDGNAWQFCSVCDLTRP